MSSREETLREMDDSAVVMRDLVKEITGTEIPAIAAGDLNFLLPIGRDTDNNPVKTNHGQAYRRRLAQKRKAKREKAANKLKNDEEKFAALMIKLKAGEETDPSYAKRLTVAKQTTRMREQLPKTAQKKWANKEFQKKMEERGMLYNCAAWKGWLPYEEAKELQQRLIGAKSRGEYEVYMKLFVIRFLPARPDRVYGEHWKGWNDFLGTVNVFGHLRKESVNPAEYRSFYEALTFARSLKLRNLKQWQAACKGGVVPMDIPIDPHNVYSEFVDIAHWLGTTKAVDVVNGKVVMRDVWVLYRDGREDACWWAKMTIEKYVEFKSLADVRVVRAYEFEPALSAEVWGIFDSLSEVYEDDQRERMISGNALMKIEEGLNAILKWV